MPVRLIRQYQGQNANTLFWGSEDTYEALRSTGSADDQTELASDYMPQTRIVMGATAITSRNATVYKMNSATAQTLTISQSGYWVAGGIITVEQVGMGSTTIVGASGVTINQGQGLTSLTTKGQRAIGQLIKEIDGSWTAIGGFN